MMTSNLTMINLLIIAVVLVLGLWLAYLIQRQGKDISIWIRLLGSLIIILVLIMMFTARFNY